MANFQTEYDGFLKDLAVLNYSPTSVLKYERCVRLFLDWLRKRGVTSIKRVGNEELRDYVDAVRQNPKYSIHYVASNIIAVKLFFRYLKKNNDILYDFSVALKIPDTKKLLPKPPLTPEEVEKMLGAPDLRSPLGMRDRAIIETFYSCGLRVMEMANLSLKDIDMVNGFLFVREGKGRVDRMLPLGQHAIFFIEEYLSKVRPILVGKGRQKGATDSDALWLNRRGLPLTKGDILFMVRYLRKKVGLQKQITPHSFRRTLGVEMIRNGADFLTVKDMLGHRSSHVTMRYLTLSGVDLTEALQKCHPRYEESKSTLLDIAEPDIKSFN
jgi:integrase/recombinase XerD